MNTLTYKSYTARIEFDEHYNILIGRLLGISDIIAFHSDNVIELRTAFEEAVEDYFECCEKIGKLPEKKPVSGKMLLCASLEAHAQALLQILGCQKRATQPTRN